VLLQGPLPNRIVNAVVDFFAGLFNTSQPPQNPPNPGYEE